MSDNIETASAVTKDDPVAETLLDCVADGADWRPEAVAQAFAARKQPKKADGALWRRYMPAVKQQAIHLARAGRIQITRKGQPVDPNDFKGIVTFRLPRD